MPAAFLASSAILAAFFMSYLSPNDPVPRSGTRPITIRDDGDSSVSSLPFIVASTKNAAAVSYDILRNGDVDVSIPARLHGL